jgi:hypothetical protein
VKFIALILILFSTNVAAQLYAPCHWKKFYDDNPDWQRDWPVTMMMGRTFRKMDTCMPMVTQLVWKQKRFVDELHNHKLTYTHTFEGESWWREDLEYLAMVGNPMQYIGTDQLSSAVGNAITCTSDDCREIVRFPKVEMKKLFGTWNTNWSYARPAVVELGEHVPEQFWAQSNLYEYHTGEHYMKPGPINIDNLALADNLSTNYHDVVDAMAEGKTYKFKVEYAGNNEVDDSSHDSGTVEFTLYFGCPSNLQFVSPAKGAKYVFSDSGEGVVEFDAEVAFDNYPELFLDKVEWKIPEKTGSIPTYVPNTRKGKKITLGYKKLPKFNSDFGETTIEAYVDLGGKCGEYRASRKVKLFFPREGTKNPSGPSEPNWYYYWQQTSAGRGTVADQNIIYSGTAGLCGSEPSFRGYYPYSVVSKCGQNHYYGNDHIRVCDFAKPQVNFQLETSTTNEVLLGIDAFAVAVAHELLHMKHWQDWWNPKGGWPTTGKRTVGAGNSCMVPQDIDMDLDFVPDNLEPALGLNPNDKFTHRAQYGTGEMWDEHYLTYKGAEDGWTPDQADKEDWSKPGHQWE